MVELGEAETRHILGPKPATSYADQRGPVFAASCGNDNEQQGAEQETVPKHRLFHESAPRENQSGQSQ